VQDTPGRVPRRSSGGCPGLLDGRAGVATPGGHAC